MTSDKILCGEECFFELPTLNLAAKVWGNPQGRPVLALHGWLDNAASFDFLAPLLNDVYLVAVDMAGHGHSLHRSADATYNIWEDVGEVLELADYLQWDHFSLLGHSRGAIISVLIAGTFPERINDIVLLDGIIPYMSEPEKAPQQLAEFIQGQKKLAAKKMRVYASVENAIAARELGTFPLSRQAAQAIISRGLKAVESGYIWSTDPRLRLPSPLRLSVEHMHAFLQGITAPIYLLTASDGLPRLFTELEKFIEPYAIVWESVEGSHHMHMEEPASDIAQRLNLWWAKTMKSTVEKND